MKIKLIDEKGNPIKGKFFKEACEEVGLTEFEHEMILRNGCLVEGCTVNLEVEDMVKYVKILQKYIEENAIMYDCKTCGGDGCYDIVRGDEYIKTNTCEDCKGTGEVELN